MARVCGGCGYELIENATFCGNCGKKVENEAPVCGMCGAEMAPGELFCGKCGAPAGAARAGQREEHTAQPVQTHPARPETQAAPPPVSQPAYAQEAYRPVTAPRPERLPKLKKNRAPLWIALAVLGAAVVGFAVWVLVPDAVQVSALPDSLKAGSAKVKVNCAYTSPDSIIPANYRSLESVVFMQCSTDGGAARLTISVEIPEFTQKYEQMVDISRAETELIIHPPLLEGAAKSLNSSKEAQLIVSVKNADTGEAVIQDSKPVKLYSRFDMQWADKDGTPYYENILAWVTPEAPEVKDLLRASADCCNELTNGGLNAIIGYQQKSGWSKEDITYTQVFAMMYALADRYQVKYIMQPFSSTDSGLQRVKTPSEVINGAGGLCAETAVTMASAIQATNMHAVLILLPGHMQTAVETWTGSGEYFLIETTALDTARAKNWADVVTYMTKDQWAGYLAQEGVVAIDCDLAGQLNIKSID